MLLCDFRMTSNSSLLPSVCGDIVLVTGGAGFLGNHVVSLLQQRAPHVREIRVLDVKPYSNFLGTPTTKPVISTVGSITDLNTVLDACKGVNSVVHIAGLVSFGTFPDVNGMEEINVNGTATVIKACLQQNVERLHFCSTVDVVIGYEDIIDGDEDSTVRPKKFLFPGYPETKYKAETLVLASNGQYSENGNKLRTLALRANVMYGEGDPYYITAGLRNAKSSGGSLMRVGNGRALFQQAYAGNTAWAFLCADMALKYDPNVGGLPYFVPDNTPLVNTFQFLSPYLACRGFTLSKIYLPYSLVYGCMCFVEMVLRWLSPLKRINMSTPACSVRYINMNLYFSSKKARKLLGYNPIYSPAEAEARCMPYYKNIEL
ncbi:3 beta-hydroxysteroid dehydrogenase/Delta 5--_4-isomerase type 4-like [Haliotis rubra]|uniref:3 beta-hydroxysteroid dehydrogenase/Delta 5-->4-isomerase type 4-like n=1 Tax=Haliotis rubra TaxID=36100 RepID=UPI001EE5DDC8|nr:3 beta-hydroxysteroid dehydrogenase/Delta 5-->4-isomerase type 4-like [Haliotis rubra]